MLLVSPLLILLAVVLFLLDNFNVNVSSLASYEVKAKK
ncbi:MAG: hypothetical protein RL172_2286 [Bacteroidota bacterium]|jgi:hypothetical protein